MKQQEKPVYSTQVSLSLSRKAFLVVLSIFFPIIIAINAGYKLSTAYMEKLLFDNFTVIADGCKKVVDQFLKTEERRVADFSSDGYIRDQLCRIVQGDASAIPPLNRHLVENKLPLDKSIYAIHVITLNGVIAASTEPTAIGKDVSGEEFFINFKNGKEITDKASEFEELPTISISSLLTDRNTGEALGIIASFISLAKLGEVMSGKVFQEMGAVTTTKSMLRTMEVYIVNSDKLMITKSRFIENAVLKQKVYTTPVEACLKSNTSMTGFYRDYRGMEIAGSSMCVPSLKWTVLVEVDKEEVYAPLSKIKMGALVLFAALAGFVGTLFFSFRRGVVAPLNRLSDAAKKIAGGDFKVAIPVLGGDEIGVLSESFNRMALELDGSITRLRHSEARLNEAQRLAHVGNWELDIANNILLWSDEIYRIFEIDPQKFGASYDAFLEIIHPDDRGLVNNEYTHSLKTRTPYSIDHRLLFPDGRIKYVHEQGETFYDAEGKPVRSTGTVQDITERKEVEFRILKINEELERRVAQRTEELTAANKELEAFSYSVSHDLRAPLRHLMGYSNLLQKNAFSRLDETGKKHLNVIAEAAKKMGNLIDDLLAFSRAGRTEMQRNVVSLNRLAMEAMEELKKDAAGRDISWLIGGLPDVHGDPSMLRLVIVNLLSNAVKFTGKKERAEIEIGSRVESGEELVIFVKDNGAGFDMKYTEKLFGVFQRLHRQTEFEGIGIGLANVRRIIHRHGGRTWAEGVVGGGATFYFSLPISRRV